MALLNFDAQGIDTTDTYQPLPAGAYNVIITDTEVKETKSGAGTYLRVTMEVQNGEYHGRKIFHNITLQNSNQTATNIGQKHLAQICFAIGVNGVNDSSELHFKPIIAVVKIRKGDGNYGDSNEVQRYESAVSAGLSSPQGFMNQSPGVQNQAPRIQVGASTPWATSR